MASLKLHVIVSASLLGLAMIFLWVAADGGQWGKQDEVDFGLLGFSAFGNYIKYSNLDNLGDVTSAGIAISFFIALASLAAVVAFVFLFLLWPLQQMQSVARNGLMLSALICWFSIFLCWAIWAGNQEHKLQNAAFGGSIRLGYCWGLTFAAWLFTSAGLYFNYQARRAEPEPKYMGHVDDSHLYQAQA